MTIEQSALDFSTARARAEEKARESTSDPMLLAWFDKTNWKHSPDIICGCGEKPAWLVYAQSREGDIEISVNDEQYVFIFRRGDCA